ncbi:MAG TPA: PSD1 and planctomycete cytochrome C domain-containing protein [Tepidisphaeraceae bacterium]
MPRLALLCAVLLCITVARAVDIDVSVLPPPVDRRIDFLEDIRPLLSARCYQCHGPEKQKSNYRLDLKPYALKGGDVGVVPIVPGDSAHSPLIQYVSRIHPEISMPPKGDPLTREEVAMLRAWIDQGARWPADADKIRVADRSDWWSLKPIVRPSIPIVAPEDRPRVRNAIDAFTLAKLREKHLTPNPEADRRTLIRRVTFDLTGLPPTPDEVESFLADPDPQAYEKLVDRLLASPRYGERWARHWLDQAHYGDTHGYDKDKVRDHAWPYRDYVIRAFNQDKPYARFVKEQLAGDSFYPDTTDGIAALGFLAAGPWDFVGHVELREGTIDKAITRNLDRDDMVAVTLNTFVSLTAQCARCHNHKFDPITQEDYYSLQAVFAGIDRADRPCGKDGSKVFAVVPLPKPRPIHLLYRGSEKQPKQEVGPGTIPLAHVPELSSRFRLPPGAPESARRAALADWITDPRNPLTWRSIVNRVWLHHFGRGLVETPNDFGHMGATPTHPQLLDYLAAEFRDGGQSIKSLHRLIVTSSTYRQSAAHNPQNAAIDAANQYLWRANRARLDAEELRDTVLAVAGQLDSKMGGPPFKTFGFKDDHSPHYNYAEYNPDDPASHRRSIYRLIVRSVPDPFMETLDCADPSQIVPRRNQTLTPLQALALLNDRFMIRMADHFAQRLAKSSPDLAIQIDTACRLAYGRPPTDLEKPTLAEIAQKHGLANTCRLIFNSNEFLFVD